LSLTADADDFTGTANNDEFTGGLTVAGSQTFNAFDRIDGGEGTDTLKATLTDGGFDTANTLSTAVQNVENFYFRTLKTGSNENDVDFTDVSSVEQIWSNNSQVDLNATNVENVVTAGVIEGELDANGDPANALDIDYASVAVVNDAVDSQGRFTQNVVLNNAAATLNISAAGGNIATAADVNAISLELDLTGESNVVLGADVIGGDELDTITTSGEGSIDLDLGALTGDLNVTLGAGDDVLRLDGTDLDANDDIDLGEGNNTLVMSGFDGTTQLSSLDLDGVANVDELAFSTAYVATAADTLDIEGRGTVTFESTVDAASSGSEILTIDTTATDLTVNFEGAVGGTDAPGLEVNEGVTNLTLNVGTAQAGAGLTLNTLTNSADASDNNSTESLETLTLVNIRDNNEEAGQSYSITLGDQTNTAELNGLNTIDLSAAGQQQANYAANQTNTDSVAIVATDAGFSGPVTIKIGEAELDYDNDAGNLREVFQFVGEEISNITIGTGGAAEFTVTAAGNGDKLDFSQFAGVDGIEDLAINSANSGADWVISAADGQFEGTITLTGIGDVEQSTLEANAFIF
jgi:hypothetical protein